MNPYEELCEWERIEGVSFLEQCGLRPGQTVLDLGCGEVHYTKPAAAAVGPEGIVYAVDSARAVVRKAQARLEETSIGNVKLIHGSHLSLDDIADGSVDHVLLFDVVHMLPRSEVFPIVKRKLIDGGLLHVLAFHEIRGLRTPEGEVIRDDRGKPVIVPFTEALDLLLTEIESYGFRIIQETHGGVHFDHFHSAYHWKRYGEVRVSGLERGTVYTFVFSGGS